MFSRILVPVDGSSHASKAAGVAGDLATKYGAQVILLHVVRPDEVGPEEERVAELEHIVEPGHHYAWIEDVPAELHKMLQPENTRARHEQIVNFLAREIVNNSMNQLSEHGVDTSNVRILFKNGKPVRRILETIDEEEIDLVVMGSRGLSDLAGALQGSVSHRVAHAAHCDVATVK